MKEERHLQDAAKLPPKWWIFPLALKPARRQVLEGQAHSFFMTEKAFCRTFLYILTDCTYGTDGD